MNSVSIWGYVVKITTKIWGSVSLLILGYLVTTGLNYYFGGQNEQRLNLTGGTKFPASLESQMVSVEFAKVLKHYEDGVMLGELEAIESGVERRTEVTNLLREIAGKDGLKPERAEEAETIALGIEKVAPVAEKAYTAMANMEDMDEDVDPQKLREALLKIQNDLVGFAESLSTDVQQELDQLERESKKNRQVALIFMVVVITLSLSIMIFVTTRYISTPLRRMVSRVQDIAEGEGDLTRRINVETRDEVGDLGKWFNVFLEKLQGIIRAVGDTTETLTLSAEDLAATSLRLTSVANRTTDQANLVSRGASGVSDNSQHAAQAVEQMTSSISEISEGAQEAALVAQQAVSAAASTNTTMTKLAESSADIGKITKVITTIAEQTNLLALNATIEAARAGIAGKGFAVVATEVKELAKATAEATDEIRQKVTTIQGQAEDAESAIVNISEVINKIFELQSGIASAVEQQSVTVMEIGERVQSAAERSAEIASNIDDVARASADTTSGARETEESAADMSMMANELAGLVGQFKYE